MQIISVQFALHYSWSTEARARRALANISALLRPGGVFIGTMPDANVIVKRLREGISIVYPFQIFMDMLILQGTPVTFSGYKVSQFAYLFGFVAMLAKILMEND